MTTLRSLADHLADPANQGRLSDSSSTGTVGSIIVGAALRFFIRIEGDSITAAKYQVFNCPDQVPAASVLSEWVTGRSVDEAAAVELSDLLTAVDAQRLQFPFQIWAIEALHDAIEKFSGGASAQPEPISPKLCCVVVME